MTRAKRNPSADERADLWRRWKDGESVSDIARALERMPGTVHVMLSASGGIAPATRQRGTRALSLAQREEISRGLSTGASLRSIASDIGCAPSTVSREVRCNGGRRWYRASKADTRADRRRLRPKPCKLAMHPRLRRFVASKLSLEWSPEQISGSLRRRFPNDDCMNVSHETIYASLFIQARGVLKKELQEHLRSRRVMRRSKKSSAKAGPRGQIIDAVSIRERPASVEDRAVPGHWEGDLITGRGNSHVATLVERKSHFTMLVKVDGKDTTTVVAALSKQIKKLPVQLRRTLTWDRGTELAHHKKLSMATDVKVYFCDPQSPWQRGTNENTNRLLRQYFPKGTELSCFSQAALNLVARRLNDRPRKTLSFDTPANSFQRSLR
jgi:IS30 family transposase